MHPHTPTVRGGAMFPKVDSLPRSERELRLRNGNAQVHRREHRPDVSRHIVAAFSGMLKEPVSVGNEARKESLQVPPNFRVRVFLDQKGSGRVQNVNGGEPGLPALLILNWRKAIAGAAAISRFGQLGQKGEN